MSRHASALSPSPSSQTSCPPRRASFCDDNTITPATVSEAFANEDLRRLAATVIGPLARPLQARQVAAKIRRSRALARRAPILLGEPLEDHLGKELERVREQLGLGEPQAQGE